jgi:hypothetical protein
LYASRRDLIGVGSGCFVMREIVTDFQPFENPKKPLKTMAHCDFKPRFLPTKIREEPKT